jgi:hypothetical protein
MTFSKTSHEGYLMVDHRASPGMSEEFARQNGLDPRFCREGAVYETATIGCPHCGSVVIKNPFRVRERAHCIKCDKYICDFCEMARTNPDYVHRTIDQIHELLTAGWGMSGSMSNPVLTPPNARKLING